MADDRNAGAVIANVEDALLGKLNVDDRHLRTAGAALVGLALDCVIGRVDEVLVEGLEKGGGVLARDIHDCHLYHLLPIGAVGEDEEAALQIRNQSKVRPTGPHALFLDMCAEVEALVLLLDLLSTCVLAWRGIAHLGW